MIGDQPPKMIRDPIKAQSKPNRLSNQPQQQERPTWHMRSKKSSRRTLRDAPIYGVKLGKRVRELAEGKETSATVAAWGSIVRFGKEGQTVEKKRSLWVL